jgi:SAM-dependent methyltransferase
VSCSNCAPVKPGAADAALAGGALAAWGGAAWMAQQPGAWLAFFMLALATAAFAGALYRRDRLHVGHVVLLGLGLRALVAALPPLLSDDAYRYVWDGLIQWSGLNPYLLTPSEATGVVSAPEVFSVLNSPDYYSVYPPVSQLIFFLAGGLYASGGLGAALGGLKAVAVAADLGVLALLARTVPARRTLLWAASPLVVLENTGQIHTEALCALALLGAVLAARRGRVWASGVLLAVGGWVKLIPWLLLPGPVLARQWRLVAGAVLAGLLLTLPYAAPGVPARVFESLGLYVRLFEFNAGPYMALKGLGWMLLGADTSKTLGPLLRLAFLAALVLVWRRSHRDAWPLERLGIWVFGLFFATATTVHPWYFVPLLALLPLTPHAGWAWQVLGVLSIGTYGFYAGGPYIPLVALGWSAWALLLCWGARRRPLTALMRQRARGKLRHLGADLPLPEGLRVLDLGAGEGYVGEALAYQGARVTLSDVMPAGRVALPTVHATGKLPFADGGFDVVLLVFVLHHTRDAEAVAREALRVGRQVIVVESVYATSRDRALLTHLDRLANGLRGGWMRSEPVHLRTAGAWEAMLGGVGRVRWVRRWGRWPHRQAAYLIEPLLQPKILAEEGQLAARVMPRVSLDERESGGPVERPL